MTRHIKFGTHTWFHIKIISVTYWDVVFLRLALFGFVLLYCLFCDVCSHMLTRLFCILSKNNLTIKTTKNVID